MVTRSLLILVAAFGLAGCDRPLQIATTTQKVAVPVLYCPAPPQTEQPAFPTVCNENASDGELAKCYKASVELWKGYSKELEVIIQGYVEAGKSSKALEDFINEKAKELAATQPPAQ